MAWKLSRSQCHRTMLASSQEDYNEERRSSGKDDGCFTLDKGMGQAGATTYPAMD